MEAMNIGGVDGVYKEMRLDSIVSVADRILITLHKTELMVRTSTATLSSCRQVILTHPQDRNTWSCLNCCSVIPLSVICNTSPLLERELNSLNTSTPNP